MAEVIIPKVYCMSLRGKSYEKNGTKCCPCKVFHSFRSSDKEKRELKSVAHLDPIISFAKPYPAGTSTTQLTKDKNIIRDSLGFRVTSDAIKEIIGKGKKRKRRGEREKQDMLWVLAPEESLTHISGQTDLEWNTFLKRGSQFDIKRYKPFLPDMFRLRKRQIKGGGYEVVLVKGKAPSKNLSAKTAQGTQPKPRASSNERQNGNQTNKPMPGSSVDNRLDSNIMESVPDCQANEIPPDDDDIIIISVEPPAIKQKPVKATPKQLKADLDSILAQSKSEGETQRSHFQSVKSKTRQTIHEHDKTKGGECTGKKSIYDQTASTVESSDQHRIVPQQSDVTKAGTSKDTHVLERNRKKAAQAGRKHHVSESQGLSVSKKKRLSSSDMGDNAKAGISREGSVSTGSERNRTRERQAGVGQPRSVQEQGRGPSKPSTSTERTITPPKTANQTPSSLLMTNHNEGQLCKKGQMIGENQFSKDTKTVVQRKPGQASPKDKPLLMDSIKDQIDSTGEARRSLYRGQHEEISDAECLAKKSKSNETVSASESSHQQQSDVTKGAPLQDKHVHRHVHTVSKNGSSATGYTEGPETCAEGTKGYEEKSGRKHRDSDTFDKVKRSETSDATDFSKAGTSYERNKRMGKDSHDSKLPKYQGTLNQLSYKIDNKPNEDQQTTQKSSNNTRDVTLLVGDSVIELVQEDYFKPNDVVVKVITAASVDSISDKITKFVQQESPIDVILHFGTRDLNKGARNIAEHIESIGRLIQAVAKITISSIIGRRCDATDPRWATVSAVNMALRELCVTEGWAYIDNDNISPEEHLRKDGIHLKSSGIEVFVGNIKEHLQYVKRDLPHEPTNTLLKSMESYNTASQAQKAQGYNDLRSILDEKRRNSGQTDKPTRQSDSERNRDDVRPSSKWVKEGFMSTNKDRSYVHHDSHPVTVGESNEKLNSRELSDRQYQSRPSNDHSSSWHSRDDRRVRGDESKEKLYSSELSELSDRRYQSLPRNEHSSSRHLTDDRLARDDGSKVKPYSGESSDRPDHSRPSNEHYSSRHWTDDRRARDDGSKVKPYSGESLDRPVKSRYSNGNLSYRQLQGPRQDWPSHTSNPNPLYPGYSGCHICRRLDHKKKDCPFRV